MGKVIKVETEVHGVGNFVRARVRFDVRKVLARFVTVLRAGQREFYQLKYEKFPKFCGACGLIGHTHLECGTGEHEEDKLKWGSFLKADWETWHGRGLNTFRGGGRTNNPGRGGRMGDFAGRGPGRGMPPSDGFLPNEGNIQTSWRYNAIPNLQDNSQDEELADTTTSPVKNSDAIMLDKGTADSGVKRRLYPENQKGVFRNRIEGGGNSTMMATHAISKYVVNEVSTKERTKRTKKDGANSSSLGSAGSQEEPVRSQ